MKLTAEQRRGLMVIVKLDLDPVRKRLLDRMGNDIVDAWDEERAEVAERGYRRYLALRLLCSDDGARLPFNADIDAFWHAHILDTRRYAEDCRDIFGRFLDHDPSLERGTPEHDAAAKMTRREYEKLFSDTAWGDPDTAFKALKDATRIPWPFTAPKIREADGDPDCA